MKLSMVLPLAAYVVLISWLGFSGADPAVGEALTGNSGTAVMALLALLYGGVTLLTVWLVGGLTLFTYKLSSRSTPSLSGATRTVYNLVLVELFMRLIALACEQWWQVDWGTLTLLLPAFAAIVVVARDRQVVGVGKLLAMAPFLLYTAADALFLLGSGS